MRRDFGWAGWPLLLALVCPALGAEPNDPKKDDTEKKPPAAANPQPKENWKAVGAGAGKLVHVNTSTKQLKVEIGRQTVELQASDDVMVRQAVPPIDYDDKGNIKRYSAKELKDLKGPGNNWGYTADFDALKQGQIVEVFLFRKVPPPGTPKPPKPKDKEEAEAAAAANAPVVRKIHILVNPN